ncbi:MULTISPECIES: TetR/AcrR family transcriptional regulator [Brevibacillus]|jgi:TetR/AcrR family transcriptional repressor of nem operon|uniref:TetR/AcrR family transcriptional regulator n=1 Tax=Brevibacillus TaxID=55080 RepID=UPI00156B7410|nr:MULTISPECIES: TetR/AcrR family transcriptional regulator [Brevibacillus]MBU8714665.1 TetR family transcriptional regulator [Brevibacillus parabrevis]MDR5001987.1 TetR/AcrR family transcriptional regulator [Brevibacillus parabrevis]MED2254619.1 TetR/AcrR family transcriptional regulator [Brevibacillus parabrevis]NRQ56986.1 TetR/AcrR family transcriptional regulator [Brevibacillus sp. HD1.4A]UED67880.1 TetR/AcrR family transcriptional regulator [Brevibacillus sp. HD3.3A]
MARTREFDEEKVLDAAMQLFWEKGYEATSLSDLTARMGIQRPSIYSAFGDKKELFETALRKYTMSHASEVRNRLQSKPSVKEAFRAFFEQVVEEEYAGDLSRGCFCINTMVELAPHDEKFEILTREHQMYLAVIFQETIERGIKSGEIDPGIDAKAVSQSLIVSLIGLTVLLKARPQRSFVENTIRVILQSLG